MFFCSSTSSGASHLYSPVILTLYDHSYPRPISILLQLDGKGLSSTLVVVIWPLGVADVIGGVVGDLRGQ